MYNVAVIIPTTKKELDLASKCANSVINCSYKNFNIFVINEGKERSEQRNIGIDKAKKLGCEYIMYLDSDQSVSPKLIEECVDLMKAGFNALYIPEVITTKGWFGKVRNYERQFYTGTVVDCVRFMRTSSCPYFNLELKGPEDSDHDRRVNGLRTVTKNVVYHNDMIGFFDYFKKKNYYAKSMTKFSQMHPDDKVLNPIYRCFLIYVEDGKWKKIIKNPIMFSAIICMILIRAIIYLKNK